MTFACSDVMRAKGFTLIELMIVVAIIGILASITVPVFSKFKIKAFNSIAISDIQSGIRTVEIFKSFGGSLPNSLPLFTGKGRITLTDGINTEVWFVSNLVSVVYVKGLTGYCLIAKHLSGDVIYMASNAYTVPVVLNAVVSQGIQLNDSGATPVTQDCSGMTKLAIASIGVN